MDQLDGRRNAEPGSNFRQPGNPGQRPPEGNPRPNPRPPRPPRPEPPRPPRPEPPRPPRPPRPPKPPRPPRPPKPPRPIPLPVPVPLPRPVEDVITVNNARVIDVDVTPQFSTVTIAYQVLDVFQRLETQTVRLVITNETTILNQFGQNIGVWGIRSGMIVNARFSSKFTRSLPPQAVAFLIRIVRYS